MFDAKTLYAQLGDDKLTIFKEITSTNDYLLQHSACLPSGFLVLAETQTKGRGRRGKQWYSPYQQNLYFSLLWKYKRQTIEINHSISLVIAITIAESLKELGAHDIAIKWPNDIYLQGRKLGGILIESQFLAKQSYNLIVGIGLNVAMQQPSQENDLISQPWANLTDILPNIDTNQLVIYLHKRLLAVLLFVEQQGMAEILKKWPLYDQFYWKKIKLVFANKQVIGRCLGINHKGELILQTAEQIALFSIGDFSLRAL